MNSIFETSKVFYVTLHYDFPDGKESCLQHEVDYPGYERMALSRDAKDWQGGKQAVTFPKVSQTDRIFDIQYCSIITEDQTKVLFYFWVGKTIQKGDAVVVTISGFESELDSRVEADLEGT
jgi:hypothetical protein